MVFEKGIRKFFAVIICSMIVNRKKEWREKCRSWIISKEENPHLIILKGLIKTMKLPRNLLLGMKIWRNWLLALIRRCHTILLQVTLRLSVLVHETLAIRDLDIIFLCFEVLHEELERPEDQKFFSFMIFSKHKQKTSIVSTLTRKTLHIYKYQEIWPLLSNLSNSKLMYLEKNFWNCG